MNYTKLLRSILLLLCVLIQPINSRKRGRRKYKRGYPTQQKPNIIFVMADDLDVTLGSPEVMYKTNRLLRQEGVTFKNAFTTSPLCCPSRSSILTGRYTHNHHVHSNNRNCSGPGWIKTEEKESFGRFMQDAGYKTAYFGKYLNNYDGSRVPPGWNHWNGLVRNSRFYNYSLNINGRIRRHKANYKKDYFTNVITESSIDYFVKHTTKNPTKPIMMVVSHSAPHGPEDAAPKHQNLFANTTAPRYPNYNYTSSDKHWIIRTTPPLTPLTSQFTDMLHRKRLQTLMALDDAIEKLYIMLLKAGQLHNTYIIFTSDHGYHLGQFNQVKGKSQPYESDIRIPLYMRGPKIPRGVVVEDIALNIDFAPTFLDIANSKAPKFMDGTSLMDIAVGSVINTVNRKILKPIWKDTFLVERGKMKKPSPSLFNTQDIGIDRLVFPSVRKIQKMCLRNGFPKPPCTREKEFVCYSKGTTWYLQKCRQGDDKKKCTCADQSTGSSKNVTGDKYKVHSLLLQLEKHFQKLKRRIKRHGLKYFNTIFKAKQDLLEPAVKGKPVNLTKSARKKIKILNQTLDTMNKKRKLEEILDRTIQQKLDELEYWQKEREKLKQNRKLKERLEQKLTKKIAKESIKKSSDPLVEIIDQQSSLNITRSCICQGSTATTTPKTPKRKKKKKNSATTGRHMNCFHFSKKHWKTPPLWTGPSFTACTNSPNSTYWCLRTLNATHNFLYCEFITGFNEYFDINVDPYQLTNIAKTIPKGRLDNLHEQLVYLKACKGAKGCFLKSGESFSNRKDMLRKWRRFERKKRHGIFVRGSLETTVFSSKS